MAIDLAMVKNGVLRVYNIRSPIAALAYAVRRAGDGHWFRFPAELEELYDHLRNAEN